MSLCCYLGKNCCVLCSGDRKTSDWRPPWLKPLFFFEIFCRLFCFPTAAFWKKCNSFKLVLKWANKKSVFSLLAYMAFYLINLLFEACGIWTNIHGDTLCTHCTAVSLREVKSGCHWSACKSPAWSGSEISRCLSKALLDELLDAGFWGCWGGLFLFVWVLLFK